MKSSIKKSTFKAIYRILDRVSPIDGDCGLLCGAACCTCEEEPSDASHSGQSDENADFSMGIYLLPGEEKMFSGNEDWLQWGSIRAEEYEFPQSWHGRVYFLRCLSAPFCERSARPLQCRFFPLAPHIDEDGALYMIYHSGELPYKCPLIETNMPLNEDFIKASYTVWTHLIRDPLILDLVEMDSAERTEKDEPVLVLYP